MLQSSVLIYRVAAIIVLVPFRCRGALNWLRPATGANMNEHFSTLRSFAYQWHHHRLSWFCACVMPTTNTRVTHTTRPTHQLNGSLWQMAMKFTAVLFNTSLSPYQEWYKTVLVWIWGRWLCREKVDKDGGGFIISYDEEDTPVREMVQIIRIQHY